MINFKNIRKLFDNGNVSVAEKFLSTYFESYTIEFIRKWYLMCAYNARNIMSCNISNDVFKYDDDVVYSLFNNMSYFGSDLIIRGITDTSHISKIFKFHKGDTLVWSEHDTLSFDGGNIRLNNTTNNINGVLNSIKFPYEHDENIYVLNCNVENLHISRCEFNIQFGSKFECDTLTLDLYKFSDLPDNILEQFINLILGQQIRKIILISIDDTVPPIIYKKLSESKIKFTVIH